MIGVHLNLGRGFSLGTVEEFKLLLSSAEIHLAELLIFNRHETDPKFFVGSGQSEQIGQALARHGAKQVIFNHTLSPGQERNLSRYLGCPVLDRIGLILHIFALRARSFEGKLQVELAQQEYIYTRLVRVWTHLERQKGGIGLRGGPGETQLEIDRRLVKDRIKALEKRLEKVRSQRHQMRKARERVPIPTVALVGYTNAGKSTLFNRLTAAETYVADQLFATLDPTLRRVIIPGFGPVILIDTVGFIQDLPHELVEAFYATLEETKEAILLLHVVDLTHPQKDENRIAVETVLSAIDATHIPQLLVYNKIDNLENVLPQVAYHNHLPQTVWVSAQKDWGMDLLKEAIRQSLSQERESTWLELPPEASKVRALLYERGWVQEEVIDENGHCRIRLTVAGWELEKIKPSMIK